MMLLPLQSLWAAVELYHVHAAAEDSTDLEQGGLMASLSDLVHGHNHGHDHDHGHQFKHSNTANADSTEPDHHHHCNGYCSVVLPSLFNSAQPELKYAEYSIDPALITSSPNSRIERPNWC